MTLFPHPAEQSPQNHNADRYPLILSSDNHKASQAKPTLSPHPAERFPQSYDGADIPTPTHPAERTPQSYDTVTMKIVATD